MNMWVKNKSNGKVVEVSASAGNSMIQMGQAILAEKPSQRPVKAASKAGEGK